jgi:hypothetical protein
MISRYLHVLYCDDVRNEVSNKTSLIGVYGADLLASEIPMVVPKLAMVITVAGDASDPIENLSIAVFRDDEQITEIIVNAQDIAQIRQLAQSSEPKDDIRSSDAKRMFAYNMVIAMAPFPIEKPFVLRVMATTEREELRGPALRIALNPIAKPAETAASAAAEESLH